MKILFFGTPEFALPSLKALHQEFELLGVVCQPDKPAGRGQKLTSPPTKVLAKELGIEVFQPEKKSHIMPIVERLKPDCIVVVAYGKILPPEVINYPTYGCINLHASLLPAYRGSAPIQRAIMAGEKITGNTVMLMDEGMDTGDILSQEEEPIHLEDNLRTLSERLSQKGASLLVRTLREWSKGNIKPILQDHSKALYAPPVQKEELRICWKADAESVRDRIRGLYPDCYTLTEKGERIKVLRVKTVEAQGSPGEVLDRKKLLVACGKDAVEVLELVSPKGKVMSGEEFMRGYKVERFL
ncbi:methionyl-tRNA formyltransferase [Hydrogenobacter sp. T-2]|uniref:methionyl-tRNA formyltransferase n=1 Tax=Pampinifervens diazotrophicum TaxID=1632018 RepID=UPI002B25BC36|nr:methionyl-tRNA formyltransferase [Hydrogenobacter sp. T-2]WPM32908.1 methionyl-tRNA formyltransferase [Hydrogenobacter sp. T-2]